MHFFLGSPCYSIDPCVCLCANTMLFAEKAMAPHSSTLAWKIPWVEEPGRLQSMGSLRVRHDWATSLSLFTFIHWRRKWQPTPVSCLENPRDGGAWWAAVYGVAQSWMRLKRLSSSSSVIAFVIFKWLFNPKKKKPLIYSLCKLGKTTNKIQLQKFHSNFFSELFNLPFSVSVNKYSLNPTIYWRHC